MLKFVQVLMQLSLLTIRGLIECNSHGCTANRIDSIIDLAVIGAIARDRDSRQVIGEFTVVLKPRETRIATIVRILGYGGGDCTMEHHITSVKIGIVGRLREEGERARLFHVEVVRCCFGAAS